jgi:hypothetical protein
LLFENEYDIMIKIEIPSGKRVAFFTKQRVAPRAESAVGYEKRGKCVSALPHFGG